MKGQRKVTPMVIWRAVWVIPYLCTLILQVVVAFIGWGYGSAKAVWENRYEGLI